MVTLWVINRQKDSLELLKEYSEYIENGIIHVIRNGYFGDERKFELYNGSKIRGVIEGKGGKSLNFPDVADRVSDDLYSKRLSIERALSELPIGNKAELRRFKNEFTKVFEQI